jgi:hypothetical protein
LYPLVVALARLLASRDSDSMRDRNPLVAAIDSGSIGKPVRSVASMGPNKIRENIQEMSGNSADMKNQKARSSSIS